MTDVHNVVARRVTGGAPRRPLTSRCLPGAQVCSLCVLSIVIRLRVP